MMAMNQLIQNLFRNCQMESEETQLMILMRRVSSEYYSGNMTDEELDALLTKICKAVSAQLASCNKDYPIDQCVTDFKKALGQSVADGIFSQFYRDITKKKSKNKPSGTPIF